MAERKGMRRVLVTQSRGFLMRKVVSVVTGAALMSSCRTAATAILRLVPAASASGSPGAVNRLLGPPPHACRPRGGAVGKPATSTTAPRFGGWMPCSFGVDPGFAGSVDAPCHVLARMSSYHSRIVVN